MLASTVKVAHKHPYVVVVLLLLKIAKNIAPSARSAIPSVLIFKKKNVNSDYFEVADETKILQLGCMKVAVTIGEDLYNIGEDEFLMTNRIDDFEEKPEHFKHLPFVVFEEKTSCFFYTACDKVY